MVDYIILILCSILIFCVFHLTYCLYMSNKLIKKYYEPTLDENPDTPTKKYKYIFKTIATITLMFSLFSIAIYLLTSILNNKMHCSFLGKYCNSHSSQEHKSTMYIEIINKFLFGGLFMYYSSSYLLGICLSTMIVHMSKYLWVTNIILMTIASIIGMIYGPINTPMYWLVMYNKNINV